MNLGEALGNEAGLVLVNGPICLSLELEYPFGPNNILAHRPQDIAPSASPLQGLKLMIHHCFPVRPVSTRSHLTQRLGVTLCILNCSGNNVVEASMKGEVFWGVIEVIVLSEL